LASFFNALGQWSPHQCGKPTDIMSPKIGIEFELIQFDKFEQTAKLPPDTFV
jgi:hypothetical protein